MRPDILLSLLIPICSPAAQEVSPSEVLLPVAPTESLLVTTAGAGETVVLVPGLFGSAFGYRHLLKLLPAAGYE